MTILETYNGDVPYATGTKVSPADANKWESNARRNALAARTAWTVGGETSRSATSPGYLWYSPALDEMIMTEGTSLQVLECDDTGLAMTSSSPSGLTNAARTITGSDVEARGIEAIGEADWNTSLYSYDGGATMASMTISVDAGHPTGQPQWLGGTNKVRIVPGVKDGSTDGYPAVLTLSASGTVTLKSYATSEDGGVYSCAGHASGATQHCVALSTNVLLYGDPLVSLSSQALPSPTSPARATDEYHAVCWDSTRSLYVMTCWTADDTIAFCTSPTGATWSAWRHTAIGAGTETTVGNTGSEFLAARIIAIDGAWFILRGKSSGFVGGARHSLLCSLNAGASWFEMSLPPIEYSEYSHLLNVRGRLVIAGPYGCAISSLIAEPTEVASEEI